MEIDEIKDIIIAILFLTAVWIFPKFDFQYFLVSLAILTISFLPHEFAHRYFARKYGYYAIFKIWPFGMLIGIILLIMSFGSVKFLAPGAVFIYPISFYGRGFIGRKENAIISISGPLVNIFISIVCFLIVTFIYKNPIIFYLAQINAWLALFNLIPIYPLDGSKIFVYDKKIWLITFIISLSIFIFSMMI